MLAQHRRGASGFPVIPGQQQQAICPVPRRRCWARCVRNPCRGHAVREGLEHCLVLGLAEHVVGVEDVLGGLVIDAVPGQGGIDAEPRGVEASEITGSGKMVGAALVEQVIAAVVPAEALQCLSRARGCIEPQLVPAEQFLYPGRVTVDETAAFAERVGVEGGRGGETALTGFQAGDLSYRAAEGVVIYRRDEAGGWRERSAAAEHPSRTGLPVCNIPTEAGRPVLPPDDPLAAGAFGRERYLAGLFVKRLSVFPGCGVDPSGFVQPAAEWQGRRHVLLSPDCPG